MMPFLSLGLVAFAYALVLLGVGSAALAWARGKGINTADAPSHWVASAALGLLINAAVYAFLFKAQFDFSAKSTAVLWVVIQGVVVAVALAKPHARQAWRMMMREVRAEWWLPLFLLAAAGLGAWAYRHFPHTLDSGQAFWTQDMLNARTFSVGLQSMFGFSALIVLPSPWFAQLPIVTIASAFKPFLFAIAAMAAAQATRATGLSRPKFDAVVLFALMLASMFGYYGMIVTGKDSIYGVAFLLSFFATLCRTDAADRGWEMAVYFAAAVVTGIITLPYGIAAYGAWLFLAGRPAWRTLLPMYALNAPIVPVVVAAFKGQPTYEYFACYAAFGLVGWGLSRAPLLGWLETRPMQRARQIIGPVLPAATLLGIALLLPMLIEIAVWQNADGSFEMQRSTPIDGKTTLVDMLLAINYQNAIIVLGLPGLLLAGATPYGRARPGIAAVAAGPFLVALFVFLHHRLGLNVLSAFNSWDLTKDIIQWLGGSLIALFVLLGVELLARTIGWSKLGYLASVAVLLGVYFTSTKPFYPRPELRRKLYRSEIGGSTDKDMAVVSSRIWQHLRAKPLYADFSTHVTQVYFYSFGMYGSVSKKLLADTLTGPIEPKAGFIVTELDLAKLMARTKAEKASLTHLASLSDADMVMWEADGQGRLDAFPKALSERLMIGSVKLQDAAYGEEVTPQGIRFQWMRQHERLAVHIPQGQPRCLTLSPFGSEALDAERRVRVVELHKTPVALAKTSLEQPAELKLLLPAGPVDRLYTLESDKPDAHFPRDERAMSYGMRMPVRLEMPEKCK